MAAKTGFSPSEIKRLAKLAKLELTPDRISILSRELSDIVSFVNQLQQVDTGNIAQSVGSSGLENVTHPDQPQPGLDQNEALAQAPSTHHGYVLVPAIFSSDSDE